MLYASFQGGKIRKAACPTKTPKSPRDPNIMTESCQSKTKGTTSIYPPSLDMHPLTLTLYGRLLGPSIPLPTSLTNSTVKQPGLEEYRKNRESGEMKTLAFLPTPSPDTYKVSSQKEREGVCRRSEEEGRCWPRPAST